MRSMSRATPVRSVNIRRSSISTPLLALLLCLSLSSGCDGEDSLENAAGADAEQEPDEIADGGEDTAVSGERADQRYHQPGGNADPYAEADFSALRGGETNLSGFAYWDRNGSGSYDMGDEPLGGVAVELTAPEESTSIRRSNVRGFANFKMSLAREDALVDRPGSYEFTVLTPPGWELSSGNKSQTVRIESLPGSMAGLVAQSLPEPVGLVPKLQVSGNVVTETPRGNYTPVSDASLVATGANGENREVDIDARGRFRFEATSGEWEISAYSANEDNEVVRQIEVDSTAVELSALVLGSDEQPSQTSETIDIDFDEFLPRDLHKIPSGLGGLHWDGLNAIEKTYYPHGAGYANTAVSGQLVAYNTSGHPATIADEEGFDFRGAYFGVGWPWAQGEELIIEAWRDDRRIARDVVVLSSFAPIWFDADYRDITELRLNTRHHWQFIMDAPRFGIR